MAAPILPIAEPRRVPAFGAFLEGWRRVLHAPVLLAGMCAIVLASWELIGAIVPPTATAESITVNTTPWWLWLFYSQLEALIRGLMPEMAAFLYRSGPLPRVAVAVFCVHGALWLFLSGGVLDRVARGRPIGTAAFFAACGVFFFRFIRLIAVVGLALYVLVRVQWAMPEIWVRVAVLVTAAIVWIIADFAKTRAVIEDRRSMIGALAASARFIRRRIWRVAGLMAFNALAMLVVVRLQMQLVSSPVPDRIAPLAAAIVVLLAVAARLACLSSQAAFFQGELAHAGYTATPALVWPDSPAVEAMDNLVKRVRG